MAKAIISTRAEYERANDENETTTHQGCTRSWCYVEDEDGNDDCPARCACARCASGDVRHCPECGPNDGKGNEGCPMCEGCGSVSL